LSIKETIYKALSTYQKWKLYSFLEQPDTIVWYLFAPLSHMELSEDHLNLINDGPYIEDGVRVDVDGGNLRVIVEGGRIAMTNLVIRAGANYSYFVPHRDWIIDGK